MSENGKAPSGYALLTELRGVTCKCGKKKARHQTFCRACFGALPVLLKGRLLYRRFGEGYEEAYVEACATLGFEVAYEQEK